MCQCRFALQPLHDFLFCFSTLDFFFSKDVIEVMGVPVDEEKIHFDVEEAKDNKSHKEEKE